MFQIERAERAKSIASRGLVYGLVLLVSGCVYFAQHTVQGACASSLDSPIRNFCVVTSQVLWRGEKPNKADATWLVEHRVGTIVNLEEIQNDHAAFDAAAAAPDLMRTIDYFHLPDFEPLHMINWSFLDTHVARFLAIVSEAPRPVYVHCMDGIDRTGVLIAAYRVLIEGSSREEAIAEMARFRSPWLRVDAKYVRGLQGDRRAEIMRKMAEWKSKLKASARIVCMRGKCTYSTINAELYTPSPRPYNGLPELEYPFHDRTITVTRFGRLCMGPMKINLSQAFAGQRVGVKQVEEKIWLVSFMRYDLGFFDHETCRIESAENPFAAKVSHVSGIERQLCDRNRPSVRWRARRDSNSRPLGS